MVSGDCCIICISRLFPVAMDPRNAILKCCDVMNTEYGWLGNYVDHTWLSACLAGGMTFSSIAIGIVKDKQVSCESYCAQLVHIKISIVQLKSLLRANIFLKYFTVNRLVIRNIAHPETQTHFITMARETTNWTEKENL